MSASIKTVEFERREAHLSSLEDEEAPFSVHGVALGAGDVTVGQSGIKKLWPAEELRAAADTLQGTNLVVDHNNGSRGVVGEVTKAGYKDGVGVIYEAELDDKDLAEKVSNGRLEVSIRGHHSDVEEMEEDDETGAKVVEDITFDNLSIVPTGAAPSNSIEMGDHEELSVAQLAQFTESLESAELQEVEPGMWVKSDDVRGITVSQVQDGEIEVDVYEESDGKWRSTGETTMVSTNELSEWDVDEEEDVGQAEPDDGDADEDDDGEEDEPEESEEAAPPDDYLFDSKEDAEAFIEDKDGLTGVHEMDEGWMPGADHEEFEEWHEAQHEEEEMEMSEDRVEGEEKSGDLEEIADQSPERYPEGERAEESTNEGDEESDVEEPASAVETNESGEGRSSAELQDYEMHTPDWSGTTESEWSSPDLEDFDTDDLSEVADHFLISSSGFPPENFSDLKLPVVEPNGDLNVNALSAVKGGRGVSAVDGLSDDMEEEIVDWVNSTANEEFDKGWGNEEEEARRRERTIDDTGNEPEVEQTGPVEVSLELINKYLRIEGNHERDSVDDMLAWLFGNNDIPMETVGDLRLASTRFLNETPGTDSFSGLTVEQFRDWLLLHGGESQGRREQRSKDDGDGLPPEQAAPVNVLTGDDLRRRRKTEESELDETTTKVINMTDDIEEKLAELDEPVAVEQSELEDLQDKADQFEDMNSSLEELRERTEVLDEVDTDQVEELRDSDDPVVVESDSYESLQDEAEQVKNVYAAALSEQVEVFDADELTDKFSIEELRQKYEDHVGDPEEELAAAPRSGDPDEEELEEAAEAESESGSDEEELAEQKREELRNMIREER